MIRIKVTSTKIAESIYDHEYEKFSGHLFAVDSYTIPRYIYDCFAIASLRKEKDVEIRVAHTTYKMIIT
jgi:hypothetical protein